MRNGKGACPDTKMVQKPFRAQTASTAKRLSFVGNSARQADSGYCPRGYAFCVALALLRSCYLDTRHMITHVFAQGHMTSSVQPATKVTHCILT